MTCSTVIKENKLRDMKWAEGIADCIEADTRKFVKYKESRPIMNIKHMIETSVELYADNTAFHQKYKGEEAFREISYRQMMERINGLGTALIHHGLKDKRIAVIGENCSEWAISYLAVLCGTGVVVPLDKELSKGELKNLLQRAEVSCVLLSSKYRDTFREISAEMDEPLMLVDFFAAKKTEDVFSWQELVDEGNALLQSGDRCFADAEIDSDAMSVILFTSGTTGASKGVMLNHKNLAADLMVSPTLVKVHTWDIFFSVLPLHHTYECTCGFLMPLYKGAGIGYCQGLKYIVKNMQEIKPTMFLGVPAIFENLYRTIWKNIRKQGKEKLVKRMIGLNRATKKIGIDLSGKLFSRITSAFGGRLRLVICGGAAINPQVLNGIGDFGILALQGYGLTECSPMGALNPDTAINAASIGVCFPGFELKTVEQNEDGIGEICIRGDNVMMGYYRMPEETAEVIDEEKWFHTGDLGYIDEKGYAYITGRKKNVIITKNGKNVYPEELEYQLSLSPYIAESFVFSSTQSGESDISIVASIRPDMELIRGESTEDPSDEEIKRILWDEVDKINETAPLYRKIKKVILRKTDFVKNTSNKLVRFAEENKAE